MNSIPLTSWEIIHAEITVFQCEFRYHTKKCNEEFDEALRRAIGAPMKMKDIEELYNGIRQKWGFR